MYASIGLQHLVFCLHLHFRCSWNTEVAAKLAAEPAPHADVALYFARQARLLPLLPSPPTFTQIPNHFNVLLQPPDTSATTCNVALTNPRMRRAASGSPVRDYASAGRTTSPASTLNSPLAPTAPSSAFETSMYSRPALLFTPARSPSASSIFAAGTAARSCRSRPLVILVVSPVPRSLADAF
jgi:hypothetical protein